MADSSAASAEADARLVGALAEGLAAGVLPQLAADFTWRGAPCTADDFARKLSAIARMQLAVLESRVVPAAATMEIAGLLQGYCGVTPAAGDRLAVVSVQFTDQVISWGLLVEARGALRAWFDPSALLQLIAP